MSRRGNGAPSSFGAAGGSAGEDAEGHGNNNGDGGDDSDDVQITGTVDNGTRRRSGTGAASMSRGEQSTEELAELARGFMRHPLFLQYLLVSREGDGGACSQPPEQRRQVTSGGPASGGGRPPRPSGGSLFQSGPQRSRADPPPRQPAAGQPPGRLPTAPAVSAAGATAQPSRGAAGGPSTGGAPSAYKRARSASPAPEPGGGEGLAVRQPGGAGVYHGSGAGGSYGGISLGGAGAMRRAGSAPATIEVCSPTIKYVLRLYRNIGQRDQRSVAVFPTLREDAPVTSFTVGVRPQELLDCRRCGLSIPIRRPVFIRLVGFSPTAAPHAPRFYRGPGQGQGVRIGAVAYCSPLCVGNINAVDPNLQDLSPHGPPIPCAMKRDEWDVTRLVLTPQVSCAIADKDEGHHHESLPSEFLMQIGEWIQEGFSMPAQLEDAVHDYYHPAEGA